MSNMPDEQANSRFVTTNLDMRCIFEITEIPEGYEEQQGGAGYFTPDRAEWRVVMFAAVDAKPYTAVYVTISGQRSRGNRKLRSSRFLRQWSSDPRFENDELPFWLPKPTVWLTFALGTASDFESISPS